MRKIGIIIFLLFCIVYLDLKAANRYAVNNDSLSNEEELVGHSIFLSFENFLNFEKLAVDVDLDDEADDGEKLSPRLSPQEPVIYDENYIEKKLKTLKRIENSIRNAISVDPTFLSKLVINDYFLSLLERAEKRKYSHSLRLRAVHEAEKLSLSLKYALAMRKNRIHGKPSSPYGRSALFNKK